MGDRIAETLSLSVDCLKSGLDGDYLETPNFKTHNTNGGSTLLQPCPPIVGMAVRVLLRLGASARARVGSDKLFYIGDTDKDCVSDGAVVAKRLESFGERIDALTLEDGTDWHIAPHQIRRFFPNVWVNYYEFGRRFPALMRFLDHESLGVAVRYAARKVQGNALSEMQRLLANRITRAIVFEGLDASGPAAAELHHIADRMRIRIVSEDKLRRWYDARADRIGTTFHPMVWGYCAWSKLAGKFARCIPKEDRAVGIPRPDGRKNECICGDGCRQFLTTDDFNPFWEHAESRHQRIALNPFAPAEIVAAAQNGVKIARKFARSVT